MVLCTLPDWCLNFFFCCHRFGFSEILPSAIMASNTSSAFMLCGLWPDAWIALCLHFTIMANRGSDSFLHFTWNSGCFRGLHSTQISSQSHETCLHTHHSVFPIFFLDLAVLPSSVQSRHWGTSYGRVPTFFLQASAWKWLFIEVDLWPAYPYSAAMMDGHKVHKVKHPTSLALIAAVEFSILIDFLYS